MGVVTVYVVEYHLEKDTWDTPERLEVAPTAIENGVISTNITGLEPNSPYEFRFFSRNDLGDSAPSPVLKVVTGTQAASCVTHRRTHTWTLAMPMYVKRVVSRPGADKWAAVQRHCSSLSRVSSCTGTHKVALCTHFAGYPLGGLCVDFPLCFLLSCFMSRDS